MRPRRWQSAFIAVIALVVAVPAHAQDPRDPLAPYVGKRVSAIVLEVQGRPETSPPVLALIAIKQGELLKREEEETSIHQLATIGGYEDVRVLMRTLDDGSVEVTFKALLPHPVEDLFFDGETGIGEAELKSRVRARYGQLLGQDVTPEHVRTKALEVLEDEGYRHAAMEYTIEPRDNPYVSIYHFHVTAGPRALIERATITNKSRLSESTIRDRTGLTPGSPYRQTQIEIGIASLKDDLRKRGFYAASVDADVPQEVSPDRWVVALAVDAGPHVDIRWDPATDKAPRKLDDYLPLERYGAVDDDILRRAAYQIEQDLRNEGYRQASATFTQTPTPGELLITYTVVRGALFQIAAIEVPEGLSIRQDEAKAILGLRPGDRVSRVRLTLARDLLLIEYRVRGFYKATVEYDFKDQPPLPGGVVPVIVQLKIAEGPRGVVKEIKFVRTTTGIPEQELRNTIGFKLDAPYLEARLAEDRFRLENLYLDRGYRRATVDVKRTFDESGQNATIEFAITEHAQARIADIQVIGYRTSSPEEIKARITLKVGDPYSEEQRRESEKQLRDFGIFYGIRIDEQPRAPDDPRAHIVITVVESPASAISYGGGVEMQNGARRLGDVVEDVLFVTPRGFVQVSRKNLGGRDRSISVFGRLALTRKTVIEDPEGTDEGFGFTEYRVTATYQERRLLDSAWQAVFGVTSEQGQRTTFNFLRKGANADASRELRPGLFSVLRYGLEFTRRFDEVIAPDDPTLPNIDRLFSQVRLSMVSTGLIWDRRGGADPLRPIAGTIASADIEVALRAIGSEVGYEKLFFQTSYFRSITKSQRHILATRVEVGLARGYPRPVLDVNRNQQVVEDLPASQRFYAGGSTTVRGIQLDRLGVPEVLTADGVSVGGSGLVILNAEIRSIVGSLYKRPLTLAAFVDAGNVYRRASDVRLKDMRVTPGFGVRYDSPLGPLRLDIGFKTDRFVFRSGRERAYEWHLSIGEAF